MDESRFETNSQIALWLDRLAEEVHPWERGHGERMAVLAVATGAELGMGESELEDLKVAAALHDVGKLKDPHGPWSEPGRAMRAEESELVRRHAEWGAELLEEAGYSEAVVSMVAGHHARMDGSGYPPVAGEESVPIGARIVAIAEFYEGVAYGPWSRKGQDTARNWLIGSWPGLWGEDVYEAFLKVERLVQPIDTGA